MEQLRKQVRKAERQLGLQRFVQSLGWCLFVTLLAAAGMILFDKFRPLGVEAWVWGAAALGLGILAAAIWAVIRSRGPIDAAIEIDRRFGLQERVSSALALSETERQTALGQALVGDAVRRVRGIDVREHFTLSPGRQLLLPLIPAVAAVLIAILVNPAGTNQAQATTDLDVKKQIENSSEALKRKLVEQRKRAEQQGLKDAQELFKRLEEATDDLAKQSQGERKQALVKLNDLARQVRERRQDLGGAEQLKNQLNQLKNIEQGPADKFLEAVKEGDFKKAAEELEQLKSQLADGKLSDQDREKLANQLEQMKQKLENLAEAHRQAQQDLQRRIDQARQEGRQDEADQLAEQLDKLQQQAPQMDQLQELAEQLGQCSQCVQNGQLDQAADALEKLQSQVSDLQEQLQELEMLDNAMQQLGQCRDQMNCQQCGGAGCEACQKKGRQGPGEGRGEGDRPEAPDEVDFVETRPPMKIGPGAASVVGQVEGPTLKGDVQLEIQQQVQSARSQSADPVTVQRLPRGYEGHAREYLDRLREGE